MNKREKLERELQGAELTGAETKISWLASELSVLQVECIAELLRAVRRAGREDERQARRAHSRKGQHRDVDDLAKDIGRMVSNGLGRRAAEDLQALGFLQDHTRVTETVIRNAVFALRMDGISDSDIGVALGCSRPYARQEVRRRFGNRPPPLTMGGPENGPQEPDGV